MKPPLAKLPRLAKLLGDSPGLLDRHHGEARSGRDSLNAEPLERCQVGRARAADDVDGRLDYPGQSADRVSVGDGKGEDAIGPAAK
jgi:hypothetical protein